MTSEHHRSSQDCDQRWQLVKDVFFSLLEASPDERCAILEDRCAGDEWLRTEVESLLAEHNEPGGILDTSIAIQREARELHATSIEQLAGQQVLHYTLETILGVGGMGVVYRAHDTRLHRPVALKLLPPHAVGDPARLRQFQREARAASALSHPNILTVYELGEVEGMPFIASELVDGPTLTELIAARRLTTDELLDMAIQVTEAVAEAHERGIVHCDLKPSNIMLTRHGRVKVLDFGLAQLMAGIAGPDPALGSTIGDSGVFRRHGTPGYMSPEQLATGPADPRNDVYSLGVVLYEMTTGQLPADDGSPPSISDVESPQDSRRTLAGRPTELDRIIRRCLARKPDDRYPNGRELAVDLERLRHRRARRDVLHKPLLVSAGVAVVVTAALVWLLRPAPKVIGDRPPTFSQITHGAGEDRFPTLSPDGQWFAWANAGDDGNWDIWRRSRVAAGDDRGRNLTAGSLEDESQPSVSPDGQQIAFRSSRDGGGLYLMGVEGESSGPARRLTTGGFHPAWSPDGREIAYSTAAVLLPESRTPSRLRVVRVADGTTRELSPVDGIQPCWSPHGYRIAYWGLESGSGQRDIWTVSADGGDPVPVTSDPAIDWNPVWSADGRFLLFISDRAGSMNVWYVPIDEASGRTRDVAQPLTTPANYVAHLAMSGNGRFLVYSRVVFSSSLERVSFDPWRGEVVGAPETLVDGPGQVDNPTVSPDGKSLCFRAWGDGQPEDLFVLDLVGEGGRRQLTRDTANDRAPRWSPDGRRIAFYSNRGGRYDVWTIDPDGTELVQVTSSDGSFITYPIWAPDGRLAFEDRGRGTFVLEPEPGGGFGAPVQLALDEKVELFIPWSWSHDGNRLLGRLTLTDPATSGVGLFTFSSGRYHMVTDHGGEPAQWLADDRHILFESGDGIHLLDTAGGESREVLSTRPDRIGRFTVSHDNRMIYYSRQRVESDLWVASFEPSAD